MTELTYGGVRVAYPYAWEYVENFLDPVYEVKVDGVTIAALWKNDLEHTKSEMKTKKEVKYLNPQIDWAHGEGSLWIQLREVKELNRLSIKYVPKAGCIVGATIQTSVDSENWNVEKESIPADQISERKMIDKGIVNYYFPGRKAKVIKVVENPNSACLLDKPIVEIYTLE